MSIDLDGYFERIGYQGPREPTLDVLNAISLAHTSTIPFENLDVLLERPIALDPASLFDKLVRQRRGGYCFEQNGLLLLVLEALGFKAVPISARVRWQQPRSVTPARTHLFVRVEIDGESWLADVGIGGLSLTSAIRLNTAEPQATPHDTRRIVREGGLLYHQVRFGQRLVRHQRVHARGDAADRSRARQLVHQRAPGVALQEPARRSAGGAGWPARTRSSTTSSRSEAPTARATCAGSRPQTSCSVCSTSTSA